MGLIRVGVSGWTYPSWRGDFYPRGLVQRLELAYAAERMSTVEINGSFYALQRPSSYEKWRDATPPGFVVAVKGGRYLTHLKRLSGVETALASFFASGPLLLGEKLGPIFWQLPATLAFDEKLLATFFDLLPRCTDDAAALASRHDGRVPPARASTEALVQQPIRHALEVRHASFRDERAARLLQRHGVSLVLSDSAGRWPMIDETTSDVTYVRLHGRHALHERLRPCLSRPLGRAVPHPGRGGAGRLRLLRQRCPRARPPRCYGPRSARHREARAAPLFRVLRQAGWRRARRVTTGRHTRPRSWRLQHGRSAALPDGGAWSPSPS